MPVSFYQGTLCACEDEECYDMMAMTLYLQHDYCWNMCEPWLDVPAIS